MGGMVALIWVLDTSSWVRGLGTEGMVALIWVLDTSSWVRELGTGEEWSP